MSAYPGQLPLPLRLRPEARFEEYVLGPNQLAVAALRRAIELGHEPYLYLFGPTGTGKSHLLHAACRAMLDRGGTAAYLPLGEPGLIPAILDGLERIRLVALDDIERISGHAAWEQGLFNLYNRLREAGGMLLVSADRPVSELPVALPDLASRLAWGPLFGLELLTDADCETLLRRAAQARGLELGEPAISYIMRRSPRNTHGLVAVLDALDQATLREKRRPTVPLIRALFERMK